MTNGQNPRKAKIICTLGPSSSTFDQVRVLASAGMNVARINFSHGTHEQHSKVIKTVRMVSSELGVPIGVLQDLQGPKIRVGCFEKGRITLETQSVFTLTSRPIMGTDKVASVSYGQFHRDVTIGSRVLLDDGNLLLKVEAIQGQDVQCRVIFGGVLSNHKGVNLPDCVLSLDCLTPKDLCDLEFGMTEEVDFVALSFVQKPADITTLKDHMKRLGREVPIVAKIEKPQAVEKISEIIDLTDIIMIARGDLGVEMPTESVPYHQKKIISLCNQRGVPVITATQMLDSMISHPRPTRAEASDVANAILDGSDAVMLSGETAIGKFPMEAVIMMDKIIRTMEKENEEQNLHRRQKWAHHFESSVALGYSASQAAEMVGASAIVCLTQSGATARILSRFRPATLIFALTNCIQAFNQLSIIWGVVPVEEPELSGNVDQVIEKLINKFQAEGRFTLEDTLVFTAGLPFSKKRSTNMLRIEKILK